MWCVGELITPGVAVGGMCCVLRLCGVRCVNGGVVFGVLVVLITKVPRQEWPVVRCVSDAGYSRSWSGVRCVLVVLTTPEA